MPASPFDPLYALTQSQKSHFLTHGYIKLSSCFTRAQASEFTANIWTRLDIDPSEKSTWGSTERVNMPWHTHVSVRNFAPKAWSAICQLLGPGGGDMDVTGEGTAKDLEELVKGGEERIQGGDEGGKWSDGFIVNFGREEFDEVDFVRGDEESEKKSLRELEGWHVDGDFFVHYCKFVLFFFSLLVLPGCFC
jgi:hypothetical protein